MPLRFHQHLSFALFLFATVSALKSLPKDFQCFPDAVPLTRNLDEAVSIGITARAEDLNSGVLGSTMAGILLRERLGINTTNTWIEFETEFDLPANIGGALSGYHWLEKHLLDFTMSAKLVKVRKMEVFDRVMGRGLVQYLGRSGYTLQLNWYMSNSSTVLEEEFQRPTWKDLTNKSRAQLFKLSQKVAKIPVEHYPGYKSQVGSSTPYCPVFPGVGSSTQKYPFPNDLGNWSYVPSLDNNTYPGAADYKQIGGVAWPFDADGTSMPVQPDQGWKNFGVFKDLFVPCKLSDPWCMSFPQPFWMEFGMCRYIPSCDAVTDTCTKFSWDELDGQIMQLNNSVVAANSDDYLPFDFNHEMDLGALIVTDEAHTLSDNMGTFMPVIPELDSQLIQNLDVELKRVVSGAWEATVQHVVAEQAAGRNVMMQTSTLSEVLSPNSGMNWTLVQLPEFEEGGIGWGGMCAGCWWSDVRQGPVGRGEVDFGYNTEEYIKLASAQMEAKSPLAYDFVRRLELFTKHMQWMTAEMKFGTTETGEPLTDYEMTPADPSRATLAACNWVKNHREVWRDWMPPVVCGIGKYFDRDSLQCTGCAPGSYADTAGLFSCIPCAAGSATSSTSSPSCRFCGVGTYVDSEGSADCSVCPANTVSILRSSSVDACTCQPGFYHPTGAFGLNCTACPTGATCLGGAALPYPQPGYFQSKAEAFQSCWPVESCSGGPDNATACRAGHTGDMCWGCEENYYAIGGMCEECSGNSDASAALLVVAVLLLFIVCLVFTKMSQGEAGFNSISICVNFCQVLSRYADFNLNWPSSASSVFKGSSSMNMNFDILQVDCSTQPDYISKWYLTMSIPLVVLGAYGLLYGAGVLWAYVVERFEMRGQHGEGKVAVLLGLTREEPIAAVDWFNALHGGYLTFLMFVYMLISGTALELFDCTFQPTEIYTLDANTTMECWDEQHWQMMPVCLLGLLMYTVGIPAYIGLRVFQHRHQLQDPEIYSKYGCFYRKYQGMVQHETEQAAVSPGIDQSHTALPSNTDHRYLWEIAVMGRKLAFNLSKLFTRYPYVNSITAQFTLLTALLAQSRASPYVETANNVLEAVLLMILILVLFCGQVILADEKASIVSFFELVLLGCFVAGGITMAYFGGLDCMIKAKAFLAGRADADADTALEADKDNNNNSQEAERRPSQKTAANDSLMVGTVFDTEPPERRPSQKTAPHNTLIDCDVAEDVTDQQEDQDANVWCAELDDARTHQM